MNNIAALKIVDDDLAVEYEVLSPVDVSALMNPERREIALALQDVDAQINLCEEEIAKLNVDIDRLTNRADGLDYTVAVASGILAGLIDSFFVGEFSLSAADEWGNKKVEEIIKKVTKNNDIKGAIKELEKKGLASDSVTNSFGGGPKHHLNDFAHHPTLIGLMFSVVTQFTSKAYGTDDRTGVFKVVEITNKKYIGKELPEKIMFGVVFWFLHMLSDIAGSKSSMSGTLSFIEGEGYNSIINGTFTSKVGTGLPGPILSLAKELSALPIFTNKDGVNKFAELISKFFNDGFDFRREIGILHELGKQAIPVIINECVVRGFYFVRRLCQEINNNQIDTVANLDKINWKNTIPFRNRTVERMMTIASGTFTAVDIADAAIRSGGFNACLLRVNFVGVGRFAIAIGVDAGMGVKRSSLINERIKIMSQALTLLNAKVYYKCAQIHYAEADMLASEEQLWLAARDAEQALTEVYAIAEESVVFVRDALSSIHTDMEKISMYRAEIERLNPGLTTDISNILKWGKK